MTAHDMFLLAFQAFNEQRYEEALALCFELLKDNPAHIEALRLSIFIYEKLDDLDNALSCSASILLVDPNNEKILVKHGVLLAQKDKHDEALGFFERALAINPSNIRALNNYGITLVKLKECEKALNYFDRALSIDPTNSNTLANKAFTLLELHRHQEALDIYDHVFLIPQNSPEYICDRGNALFQLGRYDEALASYARALSINPNYHLAHYNESLCRLLLGDLLNGWKKYESRWEVTQRLTKRQFKQPLWLGEESIAGKKLLIHIEQGHGDAIQFSRYLPLLSSLNATVYLEAYPTLQSILEPLVEPGCFIAHGNPLPDVDYHCPLLSLPLAFKTEMNSIPNTVPYITSAHVFSPDDPLLLPPTTNIRIGIVWQANRTNKNLQYRSIKLRQLLEIANDNYSLVVIQKEISDEDMALLASYPNIIDMHNYLDDYGDTAAIVDQLDLIISVDTSVVHLAGAMNKPTWVLLPTNADWRWFINRSDSPWYPSATLFRQNEFGQWSDTINSLKKALHKFDSNINERRKQ